MVPRSGLRGNGLVDTFPGLQRLFSMFPAGLAGLGLLLLRACAALMLVRDAILTPTAILPWWGIMALVAIVVALLIGFYTPIACVVSGLAQIGVFAWLTRQDSFEVAASIGVTLSLLVLGPGSFSVDGRLFGRKRIHLSNSQ